MGGSGSAGLGELGRFLSRLSGIGIGQVFLLTTKADQLYWNTTFAPGDFLIFGSETRGLPETLLAAHPERLLTIPQQSVRSLNLATAVGIVLYEAIRQLS
ncbi:MAG: TrmH family RNA methyltransferase [Verrucomicrobiales bacterium]